MATAGSSRAAWRKSSYSGGNGSCVEVACLGPYFLAVRDSKDSGGARLAFTAGQWRVFTGTLKQRAEGRAR